MADPIPPQDPFLWDTDRLCKELCFDGAAWTNDPSALEAVLREHFMDGETFLTYELLFSRKALTDCLGITAARHQMKLVRKLMILQNSSPAFSAEKESMEAGEAPVSPPPAEKRAVRERSPACTEPDNPAATIHVPPASQPPLTDLTEEPPSKRRRVVPMFVRELPPGAVAPRMPGFEEPPEESLQKTRVPSAQSSTEDLPTAYLGSKAFHESRIVALDGELESDSGSDTFQSISRSSRPRGKTRAIYSMVKKYLVKSSKKAFRLQTGQGVGADSEEGDAIIDVDHDDLPSLDEDTLREIADEKADNYQSKSEYLDSEAVENVINEQIAKIRAQWEEKKLPKLEKKAHRLWCHAQRHGLLRSNVFESHRQAEQYRNRLAVLVRDFLSLPWKTDKELRVQTQSVEQTVTDKLYHEWRSNLFSSRTAPPKVNSSSARQQPKRPTAKPFIHSDEILSSSEDEFIVADEQPEPARADSTRVHIAGPPATNGEHDAATDENEQRASSPEHTHHISPLVSFTDPTQETDIEMEGTAEGRDHGIVYETFEPFTQEALRAIAKVPPKVWSKQKDRFRLILSTLWKFTFERRERIFELLAETNPQAVWGNVMSKAYQLHENSTTGDFTPDALLDLIMLHLSFTRCRSYKRISKLEAKDMDRLEDSASSFPSFCGFLMSVREAFPQKNQIARSDAFDAELIESDDALDITIKSTSAKKSKKKEIILDKDAVALRERQSKLLEEQEERRAALRQNWLKVSAGAAESGNSARLIINESKKQDDGFIYVNNEIGTRIKDHQINGVRFLWNHIVRETAERQGCLLAHTMGLGKTMQTITFLVALRESAMSTDPAVLDQIPHDLREWKVLVICPSGLVENWKDEFLMWAPKNLMGHLITITAAQSVAERMDNAKTWAKFGGVLITGYNMFKSQFRKDRDPAVTIDKILVEHATLVVADEAHVLKNPKSKIAQLTTQMKTNARIALTGSPLANNVEEYFSMIDWVAPNFLGPRQEFRDVYATPIHQGLYNDSANYEKRKAVKLLQALKVMAAPKVDRATIKSCLKNELPPKEEFVISVPPTDMQRELYDLYITSLGEGNTKVSQASIFGILNHLALICGHPSIYRKMVLDVKAKNASGTETADFPMETIPEVLRITKGDGLKRVSLSNKIELLNKILEQAKKMGDKVLVFSQSLCTLDYLRALFKEEGRLYESLDGSTDMAKRQKMVKDFNSGNKEVYLISTNAGGVGLNIHGANRVVIFDFKWNPVQDQQAIGRCYRIGQKKPVFVYRFVTAGTFEDDLQNKAVFKMQLASRVVDQKNPISWSKRIGNLIHPVKDVDPASERFGFKGKDVILDHLLDNDDGSGILSLMSSDAFEEEDETAALTAEERQEAASLVERHHLRSADPTEYNRLMQAERRATERAGSNIARTLPNERWSSGRPVLPDDPPPSKVMPIAGTNTYSSNSASPSHPSVLRSNGPSVFGSASCQDGKKKFEQRLAAALQPLASRFARSGLDPASKAAAVSAEIQAARDSGEKGHASDTLRWHLVTKLLGTNRKLVVALASGQVGGTFLGTADEDDLHRRLLMLEAVEEDMMISDIQAGGRAKDPEV